MPKSKKSQNEQQRCIHGLFKWLQNETFDTAVTKILGRLKKKEKDKVYNIITKSVAAYNHNHCRSLKYFDIPEGHVQKLDVQMPDVTDIQSSDAESDDDSSDNDSVGSITENEASTEDTGLPDWFCNAIREKHIPQTYINLFTHHLHFCIPQAEDYTDDDSFLCSLPLLRYAFDILTDFSHDNFIYVSREQCSYKRLIVGREYSIPRLLEKPIDELSNNELNTYFQHFLETKMPAMDISQLQLLPPNFQIFMLSIIWWVANCSVPVSHIHSLLLCYVMLEAVDEKTGTFRGHHYFNNKYSSKLDQIKKEKNEARNDGNNETNELFLYKNKVQYEDCLIAASVLLKHFEIDDSIKKKPKSYDVKRIHSFAQFQCCLQQFSCLNELCRCPYQSTKFSKYYNGTFVYNIALKLENQQDPIQFVEQYISGADTVLLFYKNLYKIYLLCVEKMDIKTVQWSSKKRRRRRKGTVDDEIAFIVKGFESEVII